MSTFLLEIITPERLAYRQEVTMLLAPSASGVVGILAQHMPLFSRLIEGELVIVKDSHRSYLAIGGGFMEVTSERVSVLVSRALHAEELNEKEIEHAKQAAHDAIHSGTKGEDLRRAEAALTRANLELRVLNRHHGTSRRVD